jgi:hypothetical protein
VPKGQVKSHDRLCVQNAIFRPGPMIVLTSCALLHSTWLPTYLLSYQLLRIGRVQRCNPPGKFDGSKREQQ